MEAQAPRSGGTGASPVQARMLTSTREGAH